MTNYPGTTVGQIKTPMSSTNVGSKGGGATHDYSKARGAVTKGGGKNGGGLIKGPGAAGTGPAPTKAGSNAPGKW